MAKLVYNKGKSIEDMMEEINDQIEEFAAAFLKRTNLDPRNVVMVVRQDADLNGFTQRIWFEEKRDGNERT